MTPVLAETYPEDRLFQKHGGEGDGNELEHDDDSSYEEITAISGWVRVCRDDDVSEITAPSVAVGKNKKKVEKKKKSSKKATKPSSTTSRTKKSKFPDLGEIAEDEEVDSQAFGRSSRHGSVRRVSSPLQELDTSNRWESRGQGPKAEDKHSVKNQPFPGVPRRMNSQVQESNDRRCAPPAGPRSIDEKREDEVIDLHKRLKSSKQKNPPSAPKRTSSDASSDRTGMFNKIQSVSALDTSARRSGICRKPPCRKELSLASFDKLQRQGSADLTEAITASDCSAEFLRSLRTSPDSRDDLVNSLGLSPVRPSPVPTSTSNQATKKGVKGFFQRLFSPLAGNKKKVNFGDVPRQEFQQHEKQQLSPRNPFSSLARASSQPAMRFAAETVNGMRSPNRARPQMAPRASSVAIFSSTPFYELEEEQGEDEEEVTTSPLPTSRSKAMIKSKSVPALEQSPPARKNVPRMVSMRASKVTPGWEKDNNDEDDLMNTPTAITKSGKSKSKGKIKHKKTKKVKKDKPKSSSSSGKKKSRSHEKDDIVSPVPSIGSTKASTLSHSVSRSKSLNIIKLPGLESDDASPTTTSPVQEKIRTFESRSSLGTTDGTRTSCEDVVSVCSNKPPSIFGSNW